MIAGRDVVIVAVSVDQVVANAAAGSRDSNAGAAIVYRRAMGELFEQVFDEVKACLVDLALPPGDDDPAR